MKKILCVVILTLSGVMPCVADINSDLEKFRNQWIDLYNARSIDINELYAKQSGLLINDQFLFDQMPIAKRLHQETSTIQSAQTLATFKNDSNRYVEIGYYRLDGSDQAALYYITAWRKDSGSQWLRELDVIYDQKEKITDTPSLDFASNKWEEWANKGHASKLVKNLYTEDAIYLNKGQASLGHKEIVGRYGYMYPGYSIDLQPKQVAMVQPKLAFEIGYYDAGNGYTGHYVLIWKKQPDRSWKTNFDFNF